MALDPTSGFPTSLDSLPDPLAATLEDDTGFEHDLLHQFHNDTIENIQTKLGVDSSAVTGSIDYLLKSSSSTDPGHLHLLASGATDVTATAAEVNIMDGVTSTATEINLLAGLTGLTGSDLSIVTGTAGTASDLSIWNGDGDLVDGPTPPSGTIVGTSDTQTLTAKTLTTPVIQDYTGWITVSDTWVFGSTTTYTNTNTTYSCTFTIAGVDRTDELQAGMKIQFTQSTGGTKWGIIIKVAFSTNTTVTAFLGEDSTLVDEAITAPFYSHARSPHGFPMDPDTWTVETALTSNDQQLTPTASTWYNIGTTTIDIPLGLWGVEIQVLAKVDDTVAGNIVGYVTLSTANNSETDKDWTSAIQNEDAEQVWQMCNRDKMLTLAADDTYYLNMRSGGVSLASIAFLGAIGTTFVRARCPYL